MNWDSLSARSRQWLSVASVSIGVMLCSWMVTSGFSEGAIGSERAELDEPILADTDIRETTIDRRPAQLQSLRSEDADLAKRFGELSGRQEQVPEIIANQAQRLFDRDITTRDHVVAGRLRQLNVDLERIKALLRDVDGAWNKDRGRVSKRQPDNGAAGTQHSLSGIVASRIVRYV